jgi:hypothetical protein
MHLSGLVAADCVFPAILGIGAARAFPCAEIRSQNQAGSL